MRLTLLAVKCSGQRIGKDGILDDRDIQFF